MKKFICALLIQACCLLGYAIPKYGEGGLFLKGVQLLQDDTDPAAYYYIPRYPRMATHEDGSFKFLFIKYVGKGSAGPNGGLFHAMISFSMPEEEVVKLQDTLRTVLNNANAKIIGPVPLQQAIADGDKGLASFSVVSSILNNTTGNAPFTQKVIYSGFAPFLPKSEAALAATLSQEGATLLWESLTGKTSDVSVTLSGYYEAVVKAYKATVSAEMNTVYEHYSRVINVQEGYTRDQMRKITDELVQSQVLKVESFDRTASLNLKADEMKAILDLVTDKLIELMFDAKTGWAKVPETETAVEPEQIKGRQDRGWFSQTFLGAENTPYYSDNQFVIKKRKDIRSNKFYLDLSQTTTVKVPVYTSGNLGGVYEAMQQKGPEAVDGIFKVVNLDDASFQKRDVSFMLDGGYAESFNDIFNFVTVSFRKKYPAHNDVTADVMFTRTNMESKTGGMQQMVSYPRLGATDSEDWLNYEYRVTWNLKGSNDVLREPANASDWLTATAPGITLLPPVTRKKLTIETDRSAFGDTSTASTVVVKFLVVLGGKPTLQKTLILRARDASNIRELVLFHDPNETVAYQVTRVTPQGEQRGPLKELGSDFLMVSEAEIRR
ncbi:MAG: hypothetical protein P0Y53_21370 [Candidatus Pseudobacter hemicellulosilyticus]|uniref:Uncharacterized protein n=1 Tax=Candidatus Pseudobacter hemicellulosilyticus TaxID=3121375 RepID=A0AAJ6BG95_9BACT|nr:MAG: hypothetical protein P0Y53_21370 [Pseudobacter sp.]